MEDLCERPRKPIHKNCEASTWILSLVKTSNNISRNTHTARYSQLLPLPTEMEETHDALSAIRNCLLMTWKKKNCCKIFLQNQITILAPLMSFTSTGHSNQDRRFSTKYLQFMYSLRATYIFLTGQ